MWVFSLFTALSVAQDATPIELTAGVGGVLVAYDPFLQRRGPAVSLQVSNRGLWSTTLQGSWMPDLGEADHTLLYQSLARAGEHPRLSRLVGTALLGAEAWPVRSTTDHGHVALGAGLAAGLVYTEDDETQGYAPSDLGIDKQILPTVRLSLLAEYRSGPWGLRMHAGQGYYVEHHTLPVIADHRAPKVPFTLGLELLLTASRWPRSQPDP